VDDFTRKHLDAVEQRLGRRMDGVEGRLREVEGRLRERLDVVAHGLESTMTTAIADGFKRAAEDHRAQHAETMRQFQHVVDEAERIGALAARDRRVSALETDVTDLRERLAIVEKAIPPRRE
jgi:polyhydroxyalkanoate synthesis regulator phasin